MRQTRFTINNMARNQCDAAAEISRLQHHVEPWTAERFVEFNRGPSQTCWVAMDNWKPTDKKRVCGYVCYTIDGDYQIECIGVHPEYNERDVLDMLFDKLESFTVHYPHRRMFLFVPERVLEFQLYLRDRCWRCVSVQPVDETQPEAGDGYLFRYPGVIP